MSKLIEIILSDKAEIRDQSLDKFCRTASTEELLEECDQLDSFRRKSENLYQKVRALFFLYAIHRFHISMRAEISHEGRIPYDAYEHMLKRRFEQAIDIFTRIQKDKGPNEGISSGLSEAFHRLAFQTLADQVRYSVRHTLGNQWMFRCGHPHDQPLEIRKELLEPDSETGLFPVLNESTPVRMDITHSGWSDIFFLGMDFPEGAKVLNISVNLEIRQKGKSSDPEPPINSYFRVIDQPVLRLISIDLESSVEITRLDEVFDYAKDYLGLLKAAVIASGIIPPGMEGSGMPLSDLLKKMLGPGKGIELVSHVNNIPKGSRLAVSTNLLASLISVCMRASGQTSSLTGSLAEEERRLVAARSILGEWLGGSGGGWQDSGGIWPGIKLIRGVRAGEGDPEYGKSKGRLLPDHTILTREEVGDSTRQKLQDCLVMVHGGMAQDVGPVLEMVTEKYLLRSESEWKARMQAIRFFDDVVEKLKEGDIKSIAAFTQKNFTGPIRTIIPWTTNIYTETLIQKVEKEFGGKFWGFWMMGGMSGGGMGFIFDPSVKQKAQDRLQEILSETKKIFESAIPFAIEPVVYDFSINSQGSVCRMLNKDLAMMPQKYYILMSPALIKREITDLTQGQRLELQNLGQQSKDNEAYGDFVRGLYERMIPRSEQTTEIELTLEQLLDSYGFDPEVHQQIKSDLKSGRIGLSQNRLPVTSTIRDVEPGEISVIAEGDEGIFHRMGLEALKAGKLAIVTLAGGAGSRWTQGAGVVKTIHPFARYSGKHRSFLELHLAKNRSVAKICGREIPHIITTSFLTHDAIQNFLDYSAFFGHAGQTYLSPGRSIGLRLIPTERELRYLWEVLPQQIQDEQEQKVIESLHNALINWAKETGEGEDYIDNLPHQCVHPVGHWYEIPNMMMNGTLEKLLKENPGVEHLMVHNVDTLGANADPAVFGHHLSKGNAMTAEVITRRLDDRGGGLAKVNGRIQIVEGLALPDEKIEFDLSFYNSNTFWLDINKILESFRLDRKELGNPEKVRESVRMMARRMPTYITVKDVKKRWGVGQEDIFPVVQFEKLWGDMTALSNLDSGYLAVPRMRGQQLKEISELDGWLRDGSADYIEKLCDLE
ncbi:MAG TPA: UTP--glucose-1-phosphate uridylyltransferase [Bacteroides sp.]|nr:UTP--glucose-1-phosphate uridylyltransferase [Bacteroides sp.]